SPAVGLSFVKSIERHQIRGQRAEDRGRRPNQTSIKSSAMGLRPTDQPPKLVLRKNGRPLLKRPASGARRRRRFCVRAARSNTRLEVLSLATSPCRRKIPFSYLARSPGHVRY